MSQGLEGLLAGRTLVKRYHIEDVVGRGGFAVVYRATDTRLGRPVAVKVITLTAEDPGQREQLRERLHREARAAASLPHHPNLVTVHDVGTDPELGLDFLVMELLQGENLSQALQRGRPPLPRALRILRDAAEGLAVGHRAGLVHRDVKPGNIFLAAPHQTDDPDAYRVCLLDYGIAQVIEDDQTVTRGMGANPLSPAFASPEQLQGSRDLSPATDVFSLGVVGYQLLTGERPFTTEAGQAPAGWTVRAPVHALNPEVPLGVEAVLMRAMAVKPEERFADADAMAEALDLAMAEDETQRLAAKAHSPGIGALPEDEDEDDETVLAPAPAIAAGTMTAAGAAAARPRPDAVPHRPLPPLRPPSHGKPRRRGMPLVLLAAVLLAAAAAWAAFSSGGGGNRADAARAAGDTLADGSPRPVVDDAGVPVETGAVPPRTAVEVDVPPASEPAGGTAPDAPSPGIQPQPPAGQPQQPAGQPQQPAGQPQQPAQQPQQPAQQPQQPAQQPQQPAQPPAQQPQPPTQPPAQQPQPPTQQPPAQQPAQPPAQQPARPPAQEPRQPAEPAEPPPRPRPDPPLLGRPVTPPPPSGPRDTIFIPTPGDER